jgi:AraC family transcriptional regulator
MTPKIEIIAAKKLVGMRLRMSLTSNKTGELWRSFMPRRKEITNNLSNDLFSLQVYPSTYFDSFDASREFEKWALIEVTDFEHIPSGMEAFELTGGLYAVFLHRGSSRDNSTFHYIFNTWLPASGYVLDNRPHFEILGANYKNDSPDSEEEIWIPVKRHW